MIAETERLLRSLVAVEGVTSGAGTVNTFVDAARTEGANYWNGRIIVALTGAAAGQASIIVDDNGAGTLTVRPALFAAPGATQPYLILKQIGDIVPAAADSVDNYLASEVVGRKDDTPDYTYNATTSSIIRFLKGLLGSRVIAEGTLTTDSATVPADNARAETDDHFNGCLLMPVAGADAFQPKLIVDYTGVGGIFTLDPSNPLTQLPGLSAYVVIVFQTQFVPGVDATINRIPADVVGGKADTAQWTIDATSALMRYIKALHGAKIEATGTADAGSDANTLVDAARLEANNYWDGLTLFMVTGNNAGLSRPIVEYMLGVGIEVRSAFPNAIAVGDVYVILSNYHEIVPAADGAENYQPRDVVGNKTDTAIAVADNVSSIIRYLKGIIAAVGGGSLDGKPNVQEVIIYPVAEDAATTELTDDGTSPAYYPAVAHSTTANAEGTPGVAWSEDIDFEQEGTINIISIYAEFEWQTRFLVGAGAGTQSSSKIQMSRDGGASWVDLTDNFNNAAAAMTARIRAGVGLWVTTIVAGANQLQFRLVHWTDDGGAVSTSEAQIRSNSYIRLTYRKS